MKDSGRLKVCSISSEAAARRGGLVHAKDLPRLRIAVIHPSSGAGMEVREVKGNGKERSCLNSTYANDFVHPWT